MRLIRDDLIRTTADEKKMAFIVGPRQVGKTTLVKSLLREASSEKGYFNWDIETVRRRLIREPLDFWHDLEGKAPRRIALDEIHKYPRWKRFLKGFFDAHRGEVEVLVTGSGRLDVYQRGGDSLFGRYHLFHLLPYSVGELVRRAGEVPPPDAVLKKIEGTSVSKTDEAYQRLWQFNGFPEPLFTADPRFLSRWRNDHSQLILREDLRDLTQIRELGLVESLISLLPERVGSPLSVNALREDLGVNFKTVQNWLGALDRLYYLFALRPYSGRLARTLRREEKIYFYDWSEVEDEGRRFENLVAVHLLKACHYWTDAGYGLFHLFYIRDKEKREVDFLICNRNKPFFLIETKLSEKSLDPSLPYFHQRLRPLQSFQLVHQAPASWLVRREEGILLCSAERFLAALP